MCLAGFPHGFKHATFLHWLPADINLTGATFSLKLLPEISRDGGGAVARP
jgi:hypothetical protein